MDLSSVQHLWCDRAAVQGLGVEAASAAPDDGADLHSCSAVVAAAQAFVAEHSELYREQKRGDEAATVEGCFPPAETMKPAQVIFCLRILARLHAEVTAPTTMESRVRIFHVRDGPLRSSLKGFDSEACLADVKTVTDYLLLPKCLNQALELEAAFGKARREYQAAIGSYNLATATDPKPRLLEFLARDEKLRAVMLRALEPYAETFTLEREDDEEPALYCLIPGPESDSDFSREYFRMGCDSVLYRGVQDGLMGESVSEYGYESSDERLRAYATGCILAGRTIPEDIVWRRGITARVTDWDPEDKLYHLRQGPRYCAALAGSIPALAQFLACTDFTGRFEGIVAPAIDSGSLSTLEWLCSRAPEALAGYESNALQHAVRRRRFDAARWLVEVAGARLNCPTALHFERDCGEPLDLDTLKWLHHDVGYFLRGGNVVTYACEHGDAEMLDWYFCHLEEKGPIPWRDEGPGWSWYDFSAALRAGNMEIALLLLRQPRPAGQRLCSFALADACKGFKGDTGALDALMAIQPPLPWDAHGVSFYCLAREASELGYPQVLEWITRQSGEENWCRDPESQDFRGLLHMATLHSQAESVRWLLQRANHERMAEMASKVSPRKPSPLTPGAGGWVGKLSKPSEELLGLLAPYYKLSCFYQAAVTAVDIDLARQLKGLGVALEQGSGLCAALLRVLATEPSLRSSRCLPFLRFLAEECGLDFRKVPKCLDAAASGGGVEVVQLLVANGCKLSSDVLHEAASFGQLPMCRWLRQQGVEWPRDIDWADEVEAWAEEEQARERKEEAASGADPL